MGTFLSKLTGGKCRAKANSRSNDGGEGATQPSGWQAVPEATPELNLKGEVGVTQVTVSVEEVGVSREQRLKSRSEGRRSLNQLWPFRDILTALWKVD